MITIEVFANDKFAYIVYDDILIGTMGNFDAGFAFVQLALNLEDFKNKLWPDFQTAIVEIEHIFQLLVIKNPLFFTKISSSRIN